MTPRQRPSATLGTNEAGALTQTLQCRPVALGFGGPLGMIRPRLLDRFRLGALDEARILEPGGERIAFLLGRLGGLRQAGPFGGNVDNPFERQRDIVSLAQHKLRSDAAVLSILSTNSN